MKLSSAESQYRDELPVKSIYIFDPLPIAQQIDAVVGKYIKPPTAGVYIGSSLTPMLLMDRAYFVEGEGKKLTQLMKFEDLTGEGTRNFYNVAGELVVSLKSGVRISTEPIYPVMSLMLMQGLIDELIETRSNWIHGARNRTATELYAPYLRTFTEQEHEIQDLVHTQLEEILLTTFNDVREFIGEDRWILHFLRVSGMDFIVEKTIDYRIYQYNLQHGLNDGQLR